MEVLSAGNHSVGSLVNSCKFLGELSPYFEGTCIYELLLLVWGQDVVWGFSDSLNFQQEFIFVSGKLITYLILERSISSVRSGYSILICPKSFLLSLASHTNTYQYVVSPPSFLVIHLHLPLWLLLHQWLLDCCGIA